MDGTLFDQFEELVPSEALQRPVWVRHAFGRGRGRVRLTLDSSRAKQVHVGQRGAKFGPCDAKQQPSTAAYCVLISK
jgi:hypothetical protein